MALYQSGTGLSALVGIGTTNPASNLHVTGNIFCTNAIISPLTSNIVQGSNVFVCSNASGGNNVVIINSNAYVGIGTANPTGLIHAAGPANQTYLFEGNGLTSSSGGPSVVLRALGSTATWQSQFSIQTVYAATSPGGYTTIISQQYPAGTYNGISIYCSSVTINGSLSVTGSVSTNSDRKLKKDIELITDAIEKVKKVSGYTFNRSDMELPRQAGVIAQEIMEVLPEVVNKDDKGTLSVAYGNITALLIQALKEEVAKREALELRLSRFEEFFEQAHKGL